MSRFDDQLPDELAGTVSALQRDARDLPVGRGVDLDEVVRCGRGRIRRRRLALGGAVVAAVAVVAVGFGGLGLTRSEGQPTAPPSDAAVIGEDPQAALSAVYAGTDAAVDRAGLVPQGRTRWSVYGPVPLYGPIPVYQGGAGEVKEWISVPGFPEEGYQAEVATGTVDLGQGVLLQVSSSRVEGGLPLEADYCVWFDALSSGTGSAQSPDTECRQSTTDDGGLLITRGDDSSATYVWSGGQVEVNLSPITERESPIQASQEMTVAIATDPAVRWRQQ